MNPHRAKVFCLYFLLGCLVAGVNAWLILAASSGRSFQAALADVLLTASGMLAYKELADRNWLAVVAYIIGGGFGTWLVT